MYEKNINYIYMKKSKKFNEKKSKCRICCEYKTKKKPKKYLKRIIIS